VAMNIDCILGIMNRFVSVQESNGNSWWRSQNNRFGQFGPLPQL
jgi:hypothetical protein